MFSFMGLMNGTTDTHTNVSCTCNCKRSTSFQSMAITQLEFVQILVIVVVMMMMVVVITCLLNHYRLSARSLLSRHGRARRRHLPLPSEGSLWSSDAPGSSSAISEQVYTPRPPDRVPSYLQRERLDRFQPTYPYLPHAIIDLPPTISLSDGEEPPPYQGPCTLQLRDPEQQLELNRESVRAPPNRTVFDSPLINAGISAGRLEGAPPAYSEVIGHYYHPSSLPRHAQTQSAPPPLLVQGVIQISRTDSRNTRNKDKQKAQQV
ncbi:protein TMEPAI isoform X1 [Ctenopharyngodon idella]|uniref:protein TMEPAI isoform X1 n=1 Tax=Ctenopharyngodon idella TaxID=7959 RepID=UPI002231A6AA|nr:protein TMEPAI isoform X1 [Ctenopharyngodon idella]